ncbi:MAG: ABC transporter ATP-binding protein [Candidatus Helarchaeota archaeon]|nr:ABC transporter ATP-binding protein [Candidatus Helarchaeota archaeon]
MLILENINKKWDGFELTNINLKIKDGEFVVVLGPSGAGKTLLLEIIAGIHYPDSGKMYFNGKNITHLPPEKRNIGFVFQDYALFPHKQVWENVGYGLDVRKIPQDVKLDLIEEYLVLVGMVKLAKRYPSTLSGGEQQRVALARALIIEPDIFLLDEPLAALDYNTMIQLKDEIIRIQKQMKITTVYVTHNRLEAITLADRIIIMNKGKIVQVGSSDEIFKHPKDEFVAQFTGFENIFQGVSKYDPNTKIATINCNQFEIQTATSKEGDVKACIRPESIVVSTSAPKSSIRNVFEGKIIDFIDEGVIIKLKIDIGREISALITHQSFIDLGLDVNSTVYIGFKAVDVQIL